MNWCLRHNRPYQGWCPGCAADYRKEIFEERKLPPGITIPEQLDFGHWIDVRDIRERRQRKEITQQEADSMTSRVVQASVRLHNEEQERKKTIPPIPKRTLWQRFWDSFKY